MTAIWISGTGTDIGKTVASLALCSWIAYEKAVNVHYLKPVQCGTYDLRIKNIEEQSNQIMGGDANWVDSRMPVEQMGDAERWKWDVGVEFSEPVSPHYAARLNHKQQGNYIDTVRSKIQELVGDHSNSNTQVVIEGAGGVAVPFEDTGTTLLDLLPKSLQGVSAKGILVCSPNLGTLNHSILAMEYAQKRGLSIAGFLTVEATKPLEIAQKEASPYETPEFLQELCLDNIKTLEKIGGIPHFGHLPFVQSLSTVDENTNHLKNAQSLWEGWTPAFYDWWACEQ